MTFIPLMVHTLLQIIYLCLNFWLQKNYEAAEKHYQLALQLEPDNELVLENLRKLQQSVRRQSVTSVCETVRRPAVTSVCEVCPHIASNMSYHPDNSLYPRHQRHGAHITTDDTQSHTLSWDTVISAGELDHMAHHYHNDSSSWQDVTHTRHGDSTSWQDGTHTRHGDSTSWQDVTHTRHGDMPPYTDSYHGSMPSETSRNHGNSSPDTFHDHVNTSPETGTRGESRSPMTGRMGDVLQSHHGTYQDSPLQVLGASWRHQYSPLQVLGASWRHKITGAGCLVTSQAAHDRHYQMWWLYSVNIS